MPMRGVGGDGGLPRVSPRPAPIAAGGCRWSVWLSYRAEWWKAMDTGVWAAVGRLRNRLLAQTVQFRAATAYCSVSLQLEVP